METISGYTLVLLALLLAGCGFVAGFVWGRREERDRWLFRAGGSEPHLCDGEFYYVVPEKLFCDEFTRRVYTQDATLDREA